MEEQLVTALLLITVPLGIFYLISLFLPSEEELKQNLVNGKENLRKATENLYQKEYTDVLVTDKYIGEYNITCLNKWEKLVNIKVYDTFIRINEIKFSWESIKNAVVKTDTQIQKDISAGKILAFGVFALASKKTRTVTENYLVITYLNEFDNEEDLVFTNKNPKEDCPVYIVENIKKAYSQYKNNKSNNQEIIEALQ